MKIKSCYIFLVALTAFPVDAKVPDLLGHLDLNEKFDSAEGAESDLYIRSIYGAKCTVTVSVYGENGRLFYKYLFKGKSIVYGTRYKYIYEKNINTKKYRSKLVEDSSLNGKYYHEMKDIFNMVSGMYTAKQIGICD